jgi:23S rRNA (uridine2552-2'-O)-methyltransferase
MARYQPHDKFYRKAREQGLPSRAAFKLEEILGRFHMLYPGARVVDLGCAPGGWIALLSRAAGIEGRVVGVDLASCAAPYPNVITLTGDVRDRAVRAAVGEKLGGLADLVTSDLSPKLTGIKERDQARSAELLETALEFARAILKPDAAMIAKLFMGGEFTQTRGLFERHFARVEVVRTRASRPGSAELYLVARGFHAGLAQSALTAPRG